MPDSLPPIRRSVGLPAPKLPFAIVRLGSRLVGGRQNGGSVRQRLYPEPPAVSGSYGVAGYPKTFKTALSATHLQRDLSPEFNQRIRKDPGINCCAQQRSNIRLILRVLVLIGTG